MTYLAYVLDQPSRALLLEQVPPKFDNVIAHHVTLAYPRNEAEAVKMRRLALQLQDQEHEVEVINHYEGERIHAAGIKFNGQTTRLLGGNYHVTISLTAPAKPVDSNKLKSPTPITPFKLGGTVQLID